MRPHARHKSARPGTDPVPLALPALSRAVDVEDHGRQSLSGPVARSFEAWWREERGVAVRYGRPVSARGILAVDLISRFKARKIDSWRSRVR